jgi:hypothetical protein
VRLRIYARCHQVTIRLADEPPRWGCANQLDDGAPFRFAQAARAATTRTICQAIHTLGIEAGEALADSLRMATKVGSNDGSAQARPTAGDHAGAAYPITWCMAARGQCMNLTRFARILRWTRNEQLGHGDLLRHECAVFFYLYSL